MTDLERRKELLRLISKHQKSHDLRIGSENDSGHTLTTIVSQKSINDLIEAMELLIARDETKKRICLTPVRPRNETGIWRMILNHKQKITAERIIDLAEQAIADRGVSRDLPGGERSMKRAVELFNEIQESRAIELGTNELDGWKFMIVLKLARAEQGKFNLDDYVDAVAYCALAAEMISIYSIVGFFKGIKTNVYPTLLNVYLYLNKNDFFRAAILIAKMGEEAAKDAI